MNCYSFCVSILGKKLIFFFFKFETVQYENVQQLAAFFYLYKFPVQFLYFKSLNVFISVMRNYLIGSRAHMHCLVT